MSVENLHRFVILKNSFTLSDTKFGDSSYVSHEKPMSGGLVINPFNNLLLDLLFGINRNTPFNFSIQEETLTEMYLSIKENKSDINLNMFTLPIEKYESRESFIDVLGFLTESKMHFVTGYSASNSTQFSDVLESFKSFSLLTWYLFSIIICVIHFLFKMSIKNLKTRRVEKQRLFFKMFSHFMKQNSMEKISTCFNQIIFLLILLTTFFHFMYNCLVHTDFVVAYKPFVPKCYQDIISNIMIT